MQKSLPGNHRCMFSLRKIVFIELTAVLISSTLPISMALENTTTIPGKGTILYAAHKRPYVDDSIIRDISREPFMMVAVWKMRSLTYYQNPDGWDDEVDGAYDLIASTKINTVHLALNKWLWENDARYKPAIDELIAKCKARGLYVVMDFHTEYDPVAGVDYRKFTQMITDAASGGPSEWKDFIVDIATRYKDEPTVIGIDPLDECPPNAVYQDVWRAANLAIIDAIQAVDPSYLIFVGRMGRTSLINFGEPYPRSNIVYDAHCWYAWDVGYGGYADAYYNAQTEGDFANAYELMRTCYQNILTFFRDQYNVPVGVGSTSIGKVAYNLPDEPPLKNNFRQFEDQIKLFAEMGIYNVYFSGDRDYTGTEEGDFWNLLSKNDATQLGEAGIIYRDAIDEYFVPL
jgi:hypothetical protein